MFSKKLSRLILCTLFFMQSQHVQALSWFNAFSAAMTGAQWVLPLVPIIGQFRVERAASALVNQYPDASVETSAYVKEVLRKHSCPQQLVSTVQIKMGNNFMAWYNFYGTPIITIPKDFEECFKGKLAVEAVIPHEAAHLEHKDRLRMWATLFGTTVMAHFFVAGITYPISYLLQPYTPAVLAAFMKLPVGFAKMMIVAMVQLIFAKYKEYHADKEAAEAIKDPAVLAATVKMHLQVYEQYESAQKLDPKDRGSFERFLLDEMRTEDMYHPNYLLRSQTFADAAEKLEQVSHINS